MAKTETVPYAAQLILAQPGNDQTATITVTLVPADQVDVNGRSKPLADCTLAELRAFANTLQAGVWDAYDAITLLTLDKDEAIEVSMTLLDEAGRPGNQVADWQSQILVVAEEARQATKQTSPGKTSVAKPAPAKRRTASGAKASTPAKSPASAEPATKAGTETAREKAAEPAKKPAAKEPAPAEQEPAEAAPAKEPAGPPAVAPEPLEMRPETATQSDISAPTIVPSRARVRVAGWRLPAHMATSMAVDILIDEPPLRAMQAHALSSLDREVAGVMIGMRPEKQPDGRYVVHVIDSIAAKYTVMHGASVTYTPESWRYLNDKLWERYPDESAVMVGWYHTHPGFGIFLSGMDLFIHQNFFTQLWHVAFVLDPRARTSGFFCWNREKTKVNRYDFPWPDWAAGSW